MLRRGLDERVATAVKSRRGCLNESACQGLEKGERRSEDTGHVRSSSTNPAKVTVRILIFLGDIREFVVTTQDKQPGVMRVREPVSRERDEKQGGGL